MAKPIWKRVFEEYADPKKELTKKTKKTEPVGKYLRRCKRCGDLFYTSSQCLKKVICTNCKN